MSLLVTRSIKSSQAKLAVDAERTAYWRLLWLVALFLCFVVLAIGRIGMIGFFEGNSAFGATNGEYVPDRGEIVDRNGNPMAQTISAYAIWVKPADIIGDKQVLSQQLHQIFPDTPAQNFFEKLTSKRDGYLRKRALPEEVRRVHALGELAIEFPREAERLYPQHNLGAHILGFINRDGKGVLGIERAKNEHLSNPNSRAKQTILSVDVRVQAALESELDKGMRSSGAKSASGIIMDVHSGEVIAMATLPSFNPNRPLFANDSKDGSPPPDGYAFLSSQVNGVTNQVYELGSTFKPLTVAAALDAGTVRDLAIRYDATAPLDIGGYKIRDTHPANRWLNVPETLVHSSNIVTARLADNLGKERMDAMLRNLGFNERPEIELGERAQPIWPRNWGRITNMTVGYGHGISVTPLHLATAYCALVNGGLWHPATMYKVAPNQKIKSRRVFSAATSARMRQLLRMIVADGTGRKADAPGYRIGGKTGSAEKPESGGYNRNLVVATFAAAFPMDDPRYVIITMVDEPKGLAATGFQRTAGWTAAPIVAQLVPRIGPMLGVIPNKNRDVDVSELMPLLWAPKGE
ncbi:peptidoglycan glycosyltransferase [Sphingorhabdus lutea]|uniref:Peptidoglycan glycosyltransferase n=1 Tax=Sphingorhabdus lutea TaxID=1913578 RepID=A0A1L3JCT8_9SPHN|nr:penicillin-binding protein 2 [Sphingorhabdus lutea]APG62977.1 peptidoglycan glycosyltransferase [Sphingorhabdus lutea]